MSRADKRIGSAGEISVGGGSMSMSIAEVMGAPAAKTQSVDSAKSEPKAEQGGEHLDLASVQQAIVRRERAGRGGRTVTIISMRPHMTPQMADDLAKQMRRALGCGARAEGSDTVLQGDIQERARAWLADRGAKKVVMGNRREGS